MCSVNKVCFKCGESKDLSCFYRHKQMSDGYLNKCKPCAKNDVLKHRSENIEKIREYDRARGSRLSDEYLSSERYKASMKKGQAAWKLKNAHKIKAMAKVSSAIRNGSVKRLPCVKCGNIKAQAHHEDYTKPLDVIWFCKKHHMERHREINEEARNN